MGALGGLVASRIAREFRLGGPSFTVSSEETSGARALDVAVRLLRQGELDEAIVAAVDLAGDVRAVLETERLQPFSPSGTIRPLGAGADGTLHGDGAAALVLKRLDDAVRDGDRVYALVRGIGVASGPESDPSPYVSAMRRGSAEAGVAPASVGYLEAHGSGSPDEDRREASALAALGRDRPAGPPAPSARRRRTSATPGPRRPWPPWSGRRSASTSRSSPRCGASAALRPELSIDRSPFFVPHDPQFWLRDRVDGPRAARGSARKASTATASTSCSKSSSRRPHSRPSDRRQPLGARPAALFAIEADDPAALLRGLDDSLRGARRLLSRCSHRGTRPTLVARASQRPRPTSRPRARGRGRRSARRPAGRGAA